MVCALCQTRPAQDGRVTCRACWAALTAGRPKPTRASRCPCGGPGNPLHQLCNAQGSR